MSEYGKHFADSENSSPRQTPLPAQQQAQQQAQQVVQLSVVQEKLSKDQIVSIYNEHYDALVRLASFLLDDSESCEEVVQDAFVKLFTVAEPAVGKEVAYLRTMVLNGARSRMRKRLVRRRFVHELPEPIASAETDAMSRHEREKMIRALRRLPKRQSEVLMLRFYNDLNEAEIAETLEISTGSVKTHTSRGLASLRAFLSA